MATVAIVLHSSSKTIKNARVLGGGGVGGGDGGAEGLGGYLLNTSVTMQWINGEDHHVKVLKLPSSIMNGTINQGQ